MKKLLKITLIILVTLSILAASLFFYKGNQSKMMPTVSTLNNNSLGICGKKPNCVSSYQDKEDTHYIKAKTIDPKKFPSLKIPENCKELNRTDVYIQAICTSKVFSFVDDVEFYFDTETSKLHYRSASRVGHSDMGANRKRIMQLIDQL
jgi:uncharacterized protein (DUF1499 family)